MNNRRHQDLNVYEIMADISLAAFGIFILLYILFLVLSLNQEARMTSIEKHKNTSSISNLQARIADITSKNEAIRTEMLYDLKTRYENIESYSDINTTNLNGLIQHVNNQKHHIENRLAEFRSLTDSLETNQTEIKKEWNKYVKKFGSAPFFVIIPDEDKVIIEGEAFSNEEFRGLLKSINVGSGVYLKLQKGEELKPWLQEIIAQEGWLIKTPPRNLLEFLFYRY